MNKNKQTVKMNTDHPGFFSRNIISNTLKAYIDLYRLMNECYNGDNNDETKDKIVLAISLCFARIAEIHAKVIMAPDYEDSLKWEEDIDNLYETIIKLIN